MSLKEDLEQDIGQFFREIEGMLPEHKKKHLKLLIDKYCHISTTPVIFEKYDLEMIRSLATRDIVDKAGRVYMGKRRQEVSLESLNSLRIIEATIGYLNSKDCFKKLPKFDYKNK